jgi:import inner membrane translocase subunit TIM21
MRRRPQRFDSLELTDEKINAITDKIPQRPVGVVEGTSYTAIILAAFGVGVGVQRM